MCVYLYANTHIMHTLFIYIIFIVHLYVNIYKCVCVLKTSVTHWKNYGMDFDVSIVILLLSTILSGRDYLVVINDSRLLVFCAISLILFQLFCFSLISFSFLLINLFLSNRKTTSYLYLSHNG